MNSELRDALDRALSVEQSRFGPLLAAACAWAGIDVVTADDQRLTKALNTYVDMLERAETVGA